MWVEFFVGSLLCSERFSGPLLKNLRSGPIVAVLIHSL